MRFPISHSICSPGSLARSVTVGGAILYAQLTYAGNSAIPVLLTLRATDVQALDLFASAPNMQLLRTVAIGSEAFEEHGVRRSNNTFVAGVARGVFWPHEAGTAITHESESGRDPREPVVIAGTGDSDSGVRALKGELFVPRGSKPSFAFPRFACRVCSSVLVEIKICGSGH